MPQILTMMMLIAAVVVVVVILAFGLNEKQSTKLFRRTIKVYCGQMYYLKEFAMLLFLYLCISFGYTWKFGRMKAKLEGREREN